MKLNRDDFNSPPDFQITLSKEQTDQINKAIPIGSHHCLIIGYIKKRNTPGNSPGHFEILFWFTPLRKIVDALQKIKIIKPTPKKKVAKKKAKKKNNISVLN